MYSAGITSQGTSKLASVSVTSVDSRRVTPAAHLAYSYVHSL